MNKKTSFIILAALYITSQLSAQTTGTEGLAYTLIDSGRAYSVSKGTATASEVVIPETYNKLPVKEIAERGFADYTQLTSIKIPNSVTQIGKEVFYNCTNLSSIFIPVSVTIMGEALSLGCHKDCIIFAEAQSKPAGWDARWNRGSYRVAWGYSPGAALITFRTKNSGKITATIDGKEVNSPVTLARGKSIVFTAITDWSVKEWTLNDAIVNGTNTAYTYTNRSETETSTAEVTVRFD
jgi:hypothetical protein